MRHPPPPGVLLGLSLTKSVLIGVSLALALGLGATVTERADESAAPRTDVSDSRISRLMQRFGCAETGVGADVQPKGALVQVDGRVRRVSFSHGWRVFTRDEPGALMAVCRR